MANRLSKITTRTGDDGSTGLGDGSRIRKHALRVEVMGDIDELNSVLGVLLSNEMPDTIRVQLTQIQNSLFDLGGELCIPGHKMLADTQVAQLDSWIAETNKTHSPLKEFILPGGSLAASHAHLARTVCRRAERHLVGLGEHESVSPLALQYLNRLSDFLFVIARSLNRFAGTPDVCWTRTSASLTFKAN